MFWCVMVDLSIKHQYKARRFNANFVSEQKKNPIWIKSIAFSLTAELNANYSVLRILNSKLWQCFWIIEIVS